jgi:uncharacterized protein YmfQ (DUF2313 family)
MAEKYARMLVALLPPGRLWGTASTLSRFFFGCADELARVDERAQALLNEADPAAALELVSEMERELALDAGNLSIDERRARVAARIAARQRFRPLDFQVALAPLLGQLPENVVVIERTRAFCVSVAEDREIYRFFIYRDPTLPGAYFLESAQELVDEIKPSHTRGQVIESVSFRCDDPHSLCNRDLLGL